MVEHRETRGRAKAWKAWNAWKARKAGRGRMEEILRGDESCQLAHALLLRSEDSRNKDELLRYGVSLLIGLLGAGTDSSTTSNALTALQNICDFDQASQHEVVHKGVIAAIANLLNSPWVFPLHHGNSAQLLSIAMDFVVCLCITHTTAMEFVRNGVAERLVWLLNMCYQTTGWKADSETEEVLWALARILNEGALSKSPRRHLVLS